MRGDEAGSVLARLPALVFDVAAPASAPQLSFGDFSRDVFEPEELRKVLADDLIRAVSEGALRPGGPERDQPVRAGGEHRVVVDAIHEQPEAFFALAQCHRGLVPLRTVADDFREPDFTAAAIDQRLNDVGTPEAGPVLAHVPPVTLHPPVLQRRPELDRRDAGGNVFGRKDLRDVVPEDVPACVPEGALGPGVPGRDLAGRRERKDGVLRDAVEDEARERLSLIVGVDGLRRWAVAVVAAHPSATLPRHRGARRDKAYMTRGYTISLPRCRSKQHTLRRAGAGRLIPRPEARSAASY